MAEDSKNLTIIWSIVGGLAMIAGGVVYYEANKPTSPPLLTSTSLHISTPPLTTTPKPTSPPKNAPVMGQLFKNLGVISKSDASKPSLSQVNQIFINSNYAVGKYNGNYPGWRRALEDDWTNPRFQDKLLHAHNDNGGWVFLETPFVCKGPLCVEEGLARIDDAAVVEKGYPSFQKLQSLYSVINFKTKKAWIDSVPELGDNWTIMQKESKELINCPCLFISDSVVLNVEQAKEKARIEHKKKVDAIVEEARAQKRQAGVNASLIGKLPDAVRQFILGPMLLNSKNIKTFNSHIAKGLHRYSFIIGLSNKTYDGYRKITCDEWNNIEFREYFIDYYKKNKGIENKMSEAPVSNMLIFGRSKPIANDCQIEVADVKEQPNCKLSYCERERHGLRHFDLSRITPELLGKSTCFDPMINDYGQMQSTSITHGRLFSSNTIFPCLFVREDFKAGSSRRSSRRSQKKRTRKH